MELFGRSPSEDRLKNVRKEVGEPLSYVMRRVLGASGRASHGYTFRTPKFEFKLDSDHIKVTDNETNKQYVGKSVEQEFHRGLIKEHYSFEDQLSPKEEIKLLKNIKKAIDYYISREDEFESFISRFEEHKIKNPDSNIEWYEQQLKKGRGSLQKMKENHKQNLVLIHTFVDRNDSRLCVKEYTLSDNPNVDYLIAEHMLREESPALYLVNQKDLYEAKDALSKIHKISHEPTDGINVKLIEANLQKISKLEEKAFNYDPSLSINKNNDLSR